MHQTINRSDFHSAFHAADRGDQFSYEGREALYDYLESYEAETGCQVELDVIALCCDYAEYSDLADFQSQHGDEYETMRDVEDATIVIPVGDGDGFIVAQF